MGYRAQPRRNRPANGRSRPNANLRRLALARVRARPKPRSNAALIPLVGLLLVVGLGLSVAATTLAGGGAAIVALEIMENELPDVARFEDLDFAQPSVVYDRTGTVELARFQSERRRVVSYSDIPQLVLDAHIAVEDRTFWKNEGYDPNAIAAAGLEMVAGVRERGASTITQQLVRARLLPSDVLEGDTYVRKVKEILQSRRLTQSLPGEEGKQRIITAYLNQIYYGHNAYGIAAAAEVYFGVTDLARLTPAQAAILAGLPQAPDSYDLFKWAVEDERGRLVVPTVSTSGEALPAPVERRNYVLRNLAEGHGRWTRLTAQELEQALAEPIVVTEALPLVYKAPHFVWHMKQQLDRLLVDRSPAERGGYRIITTLDLDAQAVAERYITAATIHTQLSREELAAVIEAEGLTQDEEWLQALRGLDIHNGALLALDARRGDILAYVGSAGYYRDDLASEKLDPKFDVVGRGYRQPGSAWKPFVYAAGFENRTLTPGTLLLDATTEFARNWVPRNADLRDRGPVLLREALMYSLNTTAIRALDRVGVEEVAALAERMGLSFPRGPRHMLQAGLAGAIGTVETNMVELTAAFGALANGGELSGPRTILEIRDSVGGLVYQFGNPAGNEVLSPQSSWLVTDILRGNTDPDTNLVFGQRLEVVNGPLGERRPAAATTGTTNDMRDLSIYGYLAPPADPSAPHIVASVWLGNSDHTPPLGGDVPIIAAEGPGRVWQSFLRDYTANMPIADFPAAGEGLVQTPIDAWSGGRTGEWTRDVVDEWFIAGTQPGGNEEIDRAGILYRQMCGGWYVDPTQIEPDAPETWQEAAEDWLSRARQGRGRRGEYRTLTEYLWGERDWGGPLAPTSCPTPPPAFPTEPPPDDGGNDGGDDGGGDGGDGGG
ncbi:PBP1A family penicillin-binding protein [soil metagenome]